MSQVLVVANQTLGGADLLEYVRTRMSKGDCTFSLLVPATPRAHRSPDAPVPGFNAPLDSEDDDYAEARKRLEQGLEALHGLGATADGSVGDPDPMKAVSEQMARRHFDEVVISTLPRNVSRWLRQDLPSKVERKYHLPVSVVTAGQRVARTS